MCSFVSQTHTVLFAWAFCLLLYYYFLLLCNRRAIRVLREREENLTHRAFYRLLATQHVNKMMGDAHNLLTQAMWFVARYLSREKFDTKNNTPRAFRWTLARARAPMMRECGMQWHYVALRLQRVRLQLDRDFLCWQILCEWFEWERVMRSRNVDRVIKTVSYAALHWKWKQLIIIIKRSESAAEINNLFRELTCWSRFAANSGKDFCVNF